MTKKDKKTQLTAVLNEICNESPKRTYGLHWDKQYDSVMEYLEEIDAEGYFTIKYYNENGDKSIEQAKSNDGVIFDNIFIDFDSDEEAGRDANKSLGEAIRTAKYLQDELGLDVLVNFSGRKGGHIHILFNPITLKYPKEVLKSFCLQLDSNCKVTSDSNVYDKIKGLMRIPCSKHNKSGYYGHFIDLNDEEAIKDVMLNAEYSPMHLIEEEAKYYVPNVPNRENNTKKIKSILEKLDELADANKNATTNVNYTIDVDVPTCDSDDEFVKKFSNIYYQGVMFDVGHAMMIMLKKSGWNASQVEEFFKLLNPVNMNKVRGCIKWVYSLDAKAGLNYFNEKVALAIRKNPNLHGNNVDNTIKEYQDYFKSIFISETRESIYKISDKLIEKGYFYDDDGLYCPLVGAYYLKISREATQYSYTIGLYINNDFEVESLSFTCKKPINVEHGDRNKKLGEYVKKINKKAIADDEEPIFIKGVLSNALETIAIDIGNERDYPQINKEFDTFKKELKESEDNDEDDEEIEYPQSFEDYPKYIQDQAIKLLESGDLFGKLENSISLTHKGNENLKKKLLLVIASILFDSPVQSEVGGNTGKGKTDVVKETIANFPDKYIHIVRTISPKNIYYDRDSYNDDFNIIVFDDVVLNESMIEVIKELADNNKKVKELKTVIDGKAKKFTLKGKFLVILTYAKSNPDEELLNRLYKLGIGVYSKEDEVSIKGKIKDNEMIDAENNKMIQLYREIMKASIHKLISYDITIFNPYISFFKPDEFNNRGIKSFISLVKSASFYNYNNLKSITINNQEITIGSYDDFSLVTGLWSEDAIVQNNDLNDRKQEILKYLPEMTMEEAFKHNEEVYNKWSKSDSKAYRNKLLEKEYTLKNIARYLGVNPDTLRNDLDRNRDGTAKSLIDLGFVGKIKFDDDNVKSPNIYYKIKNDGESLKSNESNRYNRYFTFTDDNIDLKSKINIIKQLLLSVNISINNRGYIYLKKYCEEYVEDIKLEDYDSMFNFIDGFFKDFDINIYSISIENLSLEDIESNIGLNIEEKNPNQKNNTTPTIPKDENFTDTNKIANNPQNEEQDENLIGNTDIPIVPIGSFKNKTFLEEKGYDFNILLGITDALSDDDLSLNEIRNKIYPNPNPDDVDEAKVLRIELTVNKMVNDGYISLKSINNKMYYSLEDKEKNFIYGEV